MRTMNTRKISRFNTKLPNKFIKSRFSRRVRHYQKTFLTILRKRSTKKSFTTRDWVKQMIIKTFTMKIWLKLRRGEGKVELLCRELNDALPRNILK